MKTAMQEFIDELNKTLDSGMYPSTWSYRDAIVAARDIAELKLEKEKEQIMDAWIQGGGYSYLSIESDKMLAEQYYNETFNTNEK
jgi:hypothetical protein